MQFKNVWSSTLKKRLDRIIFSVSSTLNSDCLFKTELIFSCSTTALHELLKHKHCIAAGRVWTGTHRDRHGALRHFSPLTHTEPLLKCPRHNR